MQTRLSIKHLVIALLALFATALNGAQAHVGMTQGDGEHFEICNGASQQRITIAVGDPVPASSEAQTCCGDCIHAAALLPDSPARTVIAAAALTWQTKLGAHQIHPRSPLWPGAPPQGPPTLQ